MKNIQEIWDDLLSAMKMYTITVDNVLFSVRCRESNEEEKFKYCLNTIKENIALIIGHIRFDPLKDEKKTISRRLLSWFEQKPELKKKLGESLSNENLVKLAGKTDNIMKEYLDLFDLDREKYDRLFPYLI